MAGQGDRSFNSRGQTIYDRLQQAVATLFFVIMVFYAGFRGHRVVTQLPATYRTTQAPKTMPYEFLNRMFPSKIPSPTFEFPAMTFCPPDDSSTIAFAACFRFAANGDKVPCSKDYTRNVTFEGEKLQCITVNDPPAGTAPLAAETADDVLEVRMTIGDVGEGDPEGVLVATHPQVGEEKPIEGMGYSNFFGASAYTATELVGRKVYTVDLKNNFKIDYEIKASSILMKTPTGQPSQPRAPVVIEFRFPKLEATYEKAFLVLDMNNWLGEVGGVACLLFFLLRLFMAVVGFALKRSDSFAYTDLGKEYRTEGFAHY